MHNGKITFLNFKGFQKMLTKTIPQIHMSNSDVPESNPCGEDKEQNHRNLVNSKSSDWWLEPWFWHTSYGDGREGKDYDSFSLFLEMEDDSL